MSATHETLADTTISIPSNILRDYEVYCPECSQECCHPIGVNVDTAPALTSVTDCGTRVTQHHNPESFPHRGVRVVLAFLCEDGHFFDIVFQFHKGSTSCVVLRHPERD